MTDQDIKKYENLFKYMISNLKNGSYNGCYLTLGIDKNGNLKSFEIKKSLIDDFKNSKI